MSMSSKPAPWESYVVDPPQTKVNPQPPTHEVVIERGFRIPMRDGVELAAMLWRPDADGPFPTLVERGPHRMADRTGPAGEYYAARGYAVLSVGLRGFSGSGGDSTGEIPGSPDGDGYDTIEWVAAQPWCDGHVGMICGSISGLTQYQTAVEAPPHLGPLLVREGPVFQTDHNKGMFSLLGLQQVAVSWTANQFEHLPSDLLTQAEQLVKLSREQWQEAQKAEENDTPYIPITDMHLQLPIYPNPLFAGVADYYNDWIVPPEQEGPVDDGSLVEKLDRVQIPICHLGGWFDSFIFGDVTAFSTIQAAAKSARARAGQRLVVGPWVHGPDATTGAPVSLLEFGPNAALDFFAFRQRWYDVHLRGEGDLSDDPVVWLYLTGPDRWLGFESWPPPITPTNWYLDSDSLADAPPDRKQTPDVYEYDPQEPVRTLAGGGAMGIGLDQRPIEDRLLCYTSPPLAEPLTLVGPLKAVLYTSSSAPDTDWIVRLTLVRPDGASVILSGGALRARFRNGLDQPLLLEADKPERFEIEMLPISMEIPVGCRLRLTVTSSDFPAFDRNLNTGGPIGRDSEGQVAVNRIYHDGQRASHVVLPVLR